MIRRLISLFLILSLVTTQLAWGDVEFKYDKDGDTFKHIINLNKIPAPGEVVYESQLCEIPNEPPNAPDLTCMEDDPNNTKANRHTRGLFSNTNNDTYQTQHQCARVTGPSPFVRACIATAGTPGITASTCFADWECCSGHCKPEKELVFDPYNNTPIPSGTKGTCAPMPPNYRSKFPFQPDGRAGGEQCAKSEECQSRNCDKGKCKTASVCMRCTPNGKKPTFGAPCCGDAAYSEARGACAIVDKRFQAVSIADLFGIGGDGLAEQLNATSTLQALEIKVPLRPEKGVCKMEYSVAGSTDTNQESIEKVIQQEIAMRESIVMLMVFYQLWKADSNGAEPGDVFGIHAQLKKAMSKIAQAKYDIFFKIKRYEAESLVKQAQIQKSGDVSQTAVLDNSLESYQMRKEAAVIMRDALAEALIELNENYEKKDQDKDGQAEGKKYDLLMLLSGNRSAGMTCPAPDPTKNLEEDAETKTCNYSMVGQEETDESIDGEEAEELHEESRYQTGMIYRSSTNCGGRSDAMEEKVEGNEEIEEEDDGEHGDYEYEHLSRFCVGGDKNGGVTSFHVPTTGRRSTWFKRITERNYDGFDAEEESEDDEDTEGNSVTLVTTYPAFTHNRQGSHVFTNISQGNDNVRANLTAFLEDPVKHLFELRPHDGNFTISTTDVENDTKVDKGTVTRAKESATIAANPYANFLDKNLKDILNLYTQENARLLESIIYHSSASFNYMQPAPFRDNFILFLSYVLRDLYSYYDKSVTAYENFALCFQASTDDLKVRIGGDGANIGGGSVNTNGADTASLTPGDIAPGGIDDPSKSSKPAGATGGGISVGGSVGAGVSNGGGIANNAKAQERRERIQAIFAKQDSILKGARKRKNQFDKDFAGSLLSKKANKNQDKLKGGFGSMLNEARRNSALVMGKGAAPGSAVGNLLSSTSTSDSSAKGSGSGGDAAAGSLDNDPTKGGYDGRSGDGRFGLNYEGRDSSGNNYKGDGGGTVDQHGLLDSVKDEKGKYINKDGDSLWKMITNRYMSTLDRILIRKKD